MASTDTLLRNQPGSDQTFRNPDCNHGSIRVKELSERDRRRLLMHFLELPESDRLLRFGNILSDALVTRYVQRLNFARDAVFGVFDADLALVGVGHLGFVPCDTKPASSTITAKERIAEFGLSVSAYARGCGIGTKLFERAAIHCRNEDIDTLYMHCLTSNQTVIHIARKAGMQIHRAHGEAEACLKIRPADSCSLMQEAVEEQVAALDYTIRASTHTAVKWLAQIPSNMPDFKNQPE
ncbi:MAG: GNAT family N-acetyltransferase [Pseudomonadota bacterium]